MQFIQAQIKVVTFTEDTIEYLFYGLERPATGSFEVGFLKNMKIYEWIATVKIALQKKQHSAVGKNRNTGKFSPVSSELFLVKGFSVFCYRHAALHTEHYACTQRVLCWGCLS